MTLLDDISSISISKSNGYGGINDDYLTTIEQDTLIEKFKKIIKNAEGKRKKVNVKNEKPDYDIVVDYGNDETHLLHLVLGNEGENSRVMYMGNEMNGFDISSKDTEVLRGILESE